MSNAEGSRANNKYVRRSKTLQHAHSSNPSIVICWWSLVEVVALPKEGEIDGTVGSMFLKSGMLRKAEILGVFEDE